MANDVTAPLTSEAVQVYACESLQRFYRALKRRRLPADRSAEDWKQLEYGLMDIIWNAGEVDSAALLRRRGLGLSPQEVELLAAAVRRTLPRRLAPPAGQPELHRAPPAASGAEAAPISTSQLAEIWAAACEIGMNDPEVHKLAEELTGKTWLKSLTAVEASRVIDVLVQRGATSGASRRLPPDVPRLMTRWQRERIADVIRLLGWQDARPLVEGVIKRAIGKTSPRTSAEASKVVEGFKAILRRRFGDPAPREQQQ